MLVKDLASTRVANTHADNYELGVIAEANLIQMREGCMVDLPDGSRKNMQAVSIDDETCIASVC